MALEALGLIIMHALLGAGDARRVMAVSIVAQWFVFLPAAYFVGPVLGFGLTVIWLLQVTYRALQTLVFCMFWRGRRWSRIQA